MIALPIESRVIVCQIDCIVFGCFVCQRVPQQLHFRRIGIPQMLGFYEPRALWIPSMYAFALFRFRFIVCSNFRWQQPNNVFIEIQLKSDKTKPKATIKKIHQSTKEQTNTTKCAPIEFCAHISHFNCSPSNPKRKSHNSDCNSISILTARYKMRYGIVPTIRLRYNIVFVNVVPLKYLIWHRMCIGIDEAKAGHNFSVFYWNHTCLC